MVNVNFNMVNDQLQIDLVALPSGCREVMVNLPNGQHLTYQFDDVVVKGRRISIEEFRQMVEEFVDYLDINESRAENTLKGYRKRLGQFIEWLKRNEANPAEVRVWVAYYASLKRRQLSVYTCKGHYHILNRYGKWLEEKRCLPVNPMREVEPPVLPKERLPKAIYQEHIAAMLREAKTVRDRAILLFFRDTGCRAAEALSLTWGDVNLEAGKARVVGKGNKERWLYFKGVTRRALERYRETVSHKKSDPVWWSNQKGGGALTYDGLYKLFQRLAERVDVGDGNFNPHAWRHAFGRDTTRAGIPTAQLQELLGHTSIEVTKVYATFNDFELQEAHDRYSPVEDDLLALVSE